MGDALSVPFIVSWMGVISLPEPNYKLKTKYKGNELTAGCKKLFLKVSVRST